jgi:hypothetical protein
MSDRLEDRLRRALRREEPPEGFAARVVAAAEAQAARRASRWDWLRPHSFRWAAALAACLVLLAAGLALERQRQRENRARGEAAKAQVMQALRITGARLHAAQAKVTRPAPSENKI